MATESPEPAGVDGPYEQVPYPSYVFPQTGPQRLSALAYLHGLEPVSPSRCRYLEIGCGDGTNIAAFASDFPDAYFMGIDLAQGHISKAKRTAGQLGLDNAEFVAQDILEVAPRTLGTFNYIVAHGLFSWVPDNVRDRLLEILNQCLSPSGVGYISYNTLPGCHIRRIGWDLAKLRTANIGGFGERVEEARRIIQLAAEGSEPQTLQKTIYTHLHDQFSERRSENVFHDDLATSNRPFYFLEFARMLGENGLQYLCEAQPASLGDGNLPDAVREELDRVSADRSEREQYLDFIDFAAFRQSLVVRREVDQISLSPKRVAELYIQSDHTVVPKADEPSFAGFFELLRSASPKAIRISDLLTPQKPGLREPDHSSLFGYILECYAYGLVRLFTEPVTVASTVTDRPQVPAFVRWQATSGMECFTTQLGENISFGNGIVRSLISSLDGTLDRDAVAERLFSRLAIPPNESEEARKQLPHVIESNLTVLLQLGALTG